MEYIPIRGQKEYCDKIRELSGALDKDKKVHLTEFAKWTRLLISVHFQTPDFVEATIYNKEEAVIMVGHFANVCNAEQESRINHVSLWYKPWFYKHVESFLLKGPSEEYIPLRE